MEVKNHPIEKDEPCFFYLGLLAVHFTKSYCFGMCHRLIIWPAWKRAIRFDRQLHKRDLFHSVIDCSELTYWVARNHPFRARTAFDHSDGLSNQLSYIASE